MAYISVMENLLPIVLIVAMAAVLLVLLMGVIGMAIGGDFNRRYGNRLMRARIGLQLLAVVIFVLLLLTIRSRGG